MAAPAARTNSLCDSSMGMSSLTPVMALSSLARTARSSSGLRYGMPCENSRLKSKWLCARQHRSPRPRPRAAHLSDRNWIALDWKANSRSMFHLGSVAGHTGNVYGRHI